jgi:hypothetical protein
MTETSKTHRFQSLDFEAFKTMAQDPNLSCYEKIGFPDSYRAGFEPCIFKDISNKLPNLSNKNKTILDIGPGCSELPQMLIDLCSKNAHKLLVVDSKEMLDHLPTRSFIEKFSGRFPKDLPEIFEIYKGKVDVILCYSVLHYIFTEGNLFDFIDQTLKLLAPGGECLLGDIPNISKRKRFFASSAGKAYHREFTKTDEDPLVSYNCIEHGQIDDAVIFSILNRARQAGFDAYVLPQGVDLPMANRREDILIKRP